MMKKNFFASLTCILACMFGTTGFSKALADESQMDEIVISANKIETAADQATTGISVISGEEINDRQDINLGQILNSVSGVYVMSTPSLGMETGIRIRGHRPEDTQMRYNDFPLHDPTALSGDGFTSYMSSMIFPRFSLERVEVLKGAQGALYGANSIGGVVSLFSPKGFNSGNHIALSAEGGSLGTMNGSAQFNASNDKYYLNFNPYAYNTNGLYDIGMNSYGFTLGAGTKITDKTTLELDILANRSEFDNYMSPPWNNYNPQEKQDSTTINTYFLAGLTLNQEINDIWNIRLKASYSDGKRDYSEKDNNYFDMSTVYAELLNTIKPMENLTWLVGFDYERQSGKETQVHDSFDWNGNPTSAGTKFNESISSYSAYTKLLYSLFDERLLLSAGGRFNGHSDYDSRFTWDLGASYNFDFGTRIYTSLATGYRTPGVYEVGYGDNWYNYTPNIALSPEKSLNFELGVEQKLMDDKITLGAAFFMTKYDDYLDFEDGPNGAIDGHYYNAGDGKLHGFEVYAKADLHEKVSVDLAYTYNKLRFTMVDNAPREDDNKIPRNKIVGNIYLYPIDKLDLIVTGIWEDSTEKNKGHEEDAFFTMNLAATYEFNERFSVYGKINNLFDEDYTVNYCEMPGINAQAGFTLKF